MDNATQQQVASVLESFGKQVGAAGGESVDLLVQATYYHGLFEILSGAVWSVLLGAAAVWGFRYLREKLKTDEDYQRHQGPSFLWIFGGIGWVMLLVAFCVNLYAATCMWNWLAVCSPKAALAYGIANKLLGGGG